MKDKRTRGEEDRISNLPEQLIDSILGGLTVQDAVRTSIFSKRWRYRWTKMVALVFDEQFSEKFEKNGAFGHNGFIRIINKVLIFHNGPIIKFHLHIPDMFLDSFEEVDQWMILLSRNSVRELIITNSNQRYELPSYVYSCLKLRRLRLENCFFKPPAEFKRFINLKELDLNNIDFGANLWLTPISLPRLKRLCLKMSTNVYNFNIEATKLETLIVNTCPDAMWLRLLHSPCIALNLLSFWKPGENNIVRVERMTLAMMLSNLPKIRRLFMDSHFLKFVITDNIPKWLPHPVNSLECLGLSNFQLGDLDHLHGALCLLRNSPSLETLYVTRLKTDHILDVGPASNHLESPNCLDCTLNQLQNVEITALEGSRPQLLFIKLLLAHSPSLEKLTIIPRGTSNTHKRLDIAMDIIQFPRASAKAEIFYFNPSP